VRLRWDAYNGETIRLKQQKTGKLVEVPVHRDLLPVLEEAKAKRCGVFIVTHGDGRPVRAQWITDQFLEIRRKCGLERVQGRDLRRTAIVFMAEAGCTEYQIAAISGHSIEATRKILETYLVRTLPMGRAAIKKWEENENKV
jgi:integrase